MEFLLKEEKPEVGSFMSLFESTGWNSFYKATSDQFAKCLASTWYSVSAYHDNQLIGFGRIISDGILYGIICDMIVAPAHQNRGVGTAILDKLKERAEGEGLRAIWLFSAPGKSEFYRRNGFEERADDAPGMQIKLFLSQS